MHLGGHPPGLLQHVRLVLEQVQVKNAHHGRARTGRDHDIFAFAEALQHPPGQLAGAFGVTGIVQRLAAAGLVRRESNFHAQPAQHPNHTHADLGIELVDDAGYKQVGLGGDCARQSGFLEGVALLR